MKVLPVPADLVRQTWPLIDKAMQKSLDLAGTHDAVDVIQLCEDERCWLYVQADDNDKIHGAAVIDVITYPKGKECRAWLVGSNGNADWKEFTEYLIVQAKANGCRWFSGSGRAGWNKFVQGSLFPSIRKDI